MVFAFFPLGSSLVDLAAEIAIYLALPQHKKSQPGEADPHSTTQDHEVKSQVAVRADRLVT